MLFALEESQNGSRSLKVKAGEWDMILVITVLRILTKILTNANLVKSLVLF